MKRFDKNNQGFSDNSIAKIQTPLFQIKDSKRFWSLLKNKKRTAKTQAKKAKKMKRRAERMTLNIAIRQAARVKKEKQGKMPTNLHYEAEGIKMTLIQKRTANDPNFDIKQMLEEIKRVRKTPHIGFAKHIKKLGKTQVETYMKYETNLRELIERSGAAGIGLEKSVRYLHGILDGITSFHKAGYIHGDLKPENIAVSNGMIKIIDFGLSILPDHFGFVKSISRQHQMHLWVQVFRAGVICTQR